MGPKEMDVAQAQLAEVLAAVEMGEEVVLTRGGRTVARLVPADTRAVVAPLGPREAGSARGLFTVPDDFDAPLEDGDEVLLMKEGRLVAKLVPAPPDRVPGSARGLVAIRADFDDPLDDFRDYM